MARMILEKHRAYEMKIYNPADKLLVDRQLDGLTVEIVDGIMVVSSEENTLVLFNTGVMAKFIKSEQK